MDLREQAQHSNSKEGGAGTQALGNRLKSACSSALVLKCSWVQFQQIYS